MSVFKEFFENKVLFTAVLAWLCAQVLKVLLTLVLSKKLNIERLWGAGGMPSAHSSMVCALTISLARVWDSGSASACAGKRHMGISSQKSMPVSSI